MKNKLKQFSILVFSLLITLAFPNSIKAGSSDNVTGWAWSSNVGWISFNSINPTGISLNFNQSGNGGSGDYIYIPGTNFGLTETTVEAWIHPLSAADQRAPIIRMDRFYLQVFENNRLAVYWYGKSPAGYHFSSANSIPMNKWTHVAVVWNSSGVRFYINGKLDTSVSTSGTAESTNWVNVGQEDSSRRYNGMIDDVRVWNKTRTIEEIRMGMTNPLKGDESGLVGYWRFDEGSGSSAFDSSQGGKTGSIIGPTWVTQPNFGVNVGFDGNMTGYAWSPSIGWISFDPTQPYPKVPNYSARVDTYGSLDGCGGRGWICGWARACSVFESGCSGTMISSEKRGGWDGWILLGPDGSSPGIWLDEKESHFTLRGYSWGAEPVGWISFNCNDGGNCSQNAYNVDTSYLLNSPPEVTSSDVALNYCAHGLTPTAATGLSVTFNWEYYDRDGDPQDRYEIQVSEDSNFPSNNRFEKVAVSEGKGYVFDPTEDAFWQNELDWNKTYYWRVRVHDGNFWSQEWYTDSFTVERTHPSPLVAFSHSPEQISVDEVITFFAQDDENVSQVYDGSTPYYEWTFEEGNPSRVTSSDTATTTFEQQGGWSATLKITDGSSYSCSLTKALEVKVPLPDWKEVTPFGKFKILLGSIFGKIFG